jgi:hypothetical protein
MKNHTLEQLTGRAADYLVFLITFIIVAILYLL